MSGGNAAVDTPEVGLINLPELYISTQGRLRSTLENGLNSGKVHLAERLDDVLMRQGFWEDDIHVDDGALVDLEAYDTVASFIIRGFLDEINGHLDEIDNSLSATDKNVSGSPRYVLVFPPSSRRFIPCSYAHFKRHVKLSTSVPSGGGTAYLTMTSETSLENEEVSLLCEMNTRLCDQVEIFHAVAANNAAAATGHDRKASEIGQLRRQLEEEDEKLHTYPSNKVFAPSQDGESEDALGSATKRRDTNRRDDRPKILTREHPRKHDRAQSLAKDMSQAHFAPSASTPKSSGTQYWGCGHCGATLMSIRFDMYCTECLRRKDYYARMY